MRIVFLSLEFSSGTFSGNGVYAMSQVRALSAAGHHVLVASARPRDLQAQGGVPGQLGALHHVEVDVSTWGRLDAGAPYQEYAAGLADPQRLATITSFQPEVVLGVDWSSLPAYRNLSPALGSSVPFIFLNYRVFSRTATGDDLILLQRLEVAAVHEAAATVVLSRSDKGFLVQMAPKEVTEHPPQVLLPALREDVRLLPPPALMDETAHSNADAAQQQHDWCPSSEASTSFAAARPYLTCVVRISPEKDPHRFVELVEVLQKRGVLAKHGLTPLLLGAQSDEYAQALKDRLRAAAPSSTILEQFMGPAELADIYRQTRLNVHPPLYDAYGMTIVEAASQGAPSVVHDGNGAVGATDLLSAGEGEVFLVNMDNGAEVLADHVERILEDRLALLRTALHAMHKARSWDEAANAEGLAAIIQRVKGDSRG